ncbi:MAG: type III-B CRISPR module RAMP protein Cmr6 [Nitrospinae bacterium]|nr:type III-B CRISPR module RAMP protein Cmr6 [Nitrospinota bacterium]MBF0633512.1 type III-B CRISPR module RAMP protein Cmr6 [Nitrospinota bacterium]
MSNLCVPPTTAKLVEDQLRNNDCNHSLVLDKFSIRNEPGNEQKQQEKQKEVLNKVAELNNKSFGEFKNWLKRRNDSLLPNALTWECRTTGPLTLHLSRASALENAGICLHPIYGFVYLPGSGLKGMARAYAETIWLADQKDKQTAFNDIESVFGWAPHSNDKKDYLQREWLPKHGKGDSASAGSIVFHDAWPTAWPKLVVDIVNNHHSKYYQGKNNNDAPGDWENPIPVYFLAIGSGETFSFVLSKRRNDVDQRLVDLAQTWLTGALCHMGAGAKTNAGYGSFKPVDENKNTIPSIKDSTALKTFTATLELVTPAFLAGANQKAEDCDLRPATLRGVLRWWWRTMHAGYLDVATLRKLEAAIWGDTNTGGAVRLEITGNKPSVHPLLVKKEGTSKNGRKILELDGDFVRKNDLMPAPRMTTQPLIYASYGMDELDKVEKRHQRNVIDPGAAWQVGLIARKGFYVYKNGDKKSSFEISPEIAFEQAKAALWLLCNYGGVGAKSGKGFGSLVISKETRFEYSLTTCISVAERLHTHLKSCPDFRSAKPLEPESSSLSVMLTPVEVKTIWKNYWGVLDQLGAAYMGFSQANGKTGHGKHCPSKIAMGLPRQIHGPRNNPLSHQDAKTWQQPEQLQGPKGDRHTSPVHFHLAKADDGTLIIRIVAFPSKYLPDMKRSKDFLGRFLMHLKDDLTKRANEHHGKWQNAPQSSPLSSIPQKRDSGSPAKVKILAERPKGGFDVQEPGKNAGTLTVGTPPSPPPGIGDEVNVLVHDDNQQKPQYKWGSPTPPKSGKAANPRQPNHRR